MTPTTYNICNPPMCDCKDFYHPCVDEDARLRKLGGLHQRDSNLDGVPKDLLNAIAEFIPRTNGDFKHTTDNEDGTPTIEFITRDPPELSEAMRGFEELSTYVRTALSPITVPVREAGDAYRWDEFKKKSVNLIKEKSADPITMLTLFTIGIALDGSMALMAAKVASSFAGQSIVIQWIASTTMGSGIALGTEFPWQNFPGAWNRLTPAQKNLTLYSIEGAGFLAFIAAHLMGVPMGVSMGVPIAHSTSCITGTAIGGVIKLVLDTVDTERLNGRWRKVLISGMYTGIAIMHCYMFYNILRSE